MKQHYKVIVCLVFCFTLLNCTTDQKEINELVSFDIGPNGKNIVFSWNKNNKLSIYQCEIDGKNVQKILGNDSLSFFAPKFNESGDSIVYIISDDRTRTATSLGLYNRVEKKQEMVYNDATLKTEVIFSENKNTLYFLRAGEYDKYSPIGRKAPHGFDIYEFSFKDKSEKRITNLEAYQIKHLSCLKNGRLLFSSFLEQSDGVFLYDDTKKELEKIKIGNDSLNSLNGFSEAEYIDDETLVVASYYKVILVNLKKHTYKNIYRSNTGNTFNTIRYSPELHKIFFSEQKENMIKIMDLNGNLVKTINLNID